MATETQQNRKAHMMCVKIWLAKVILWSSWHSVVVDGGLRKTLRATDVLLQTLQWKLLDLQLDTS